MNNDKTIKNSSQDACAAISGDFNIFEAYIRGLAEELEQTPNSNSPLKFSTSDEQTPFSPMFQLPIPKTMT